MWWWLSFASEAGFRGVALVNAPDFMSAILRTHALRINPGGEVNGWEVPENAGLGDPPERFRDRLLDKAAANEASEAWTGHPIVSTLDVDPIEPYALDERRNEGE